MDNPSNEPTHNDDTWTFNNPDFSGQRINETFNEQLLDFQSNNLQPSTHEPVDSPDLLNMFGNRQFCPILVDF